MAKKNIGATLSIKDGNFTTGIKNAVTGLKNLKNHTTNATGSLKKFGTQSKSTGDTLSGLAKKVTGVVAAYAGFSQVKNFMTDCVTGVLELERANERLGTLMMNVKGTTQAQVDEIIKYGDALELVTTIEGDATVVGASQLATFQLQGDTIKTLLPALQDLAVSSYGVSVSQEQMQSMANLLGKVMTGSTSALTRYGVIMDENQKKILQTGTESERAAILVEVLGQNFGGLAESMAKTPEGRIVQLRNAWGSVKDIVGYGVLPAITSVVTFLASKIPAAQAVMTKAVDAVKVPFIWIKDNVLPPLVTAFQNVWNYGVSAFNNIKSAVEQNESKFASVGTLLTGVRDALFNAFEFCKPALNWVKDTGLPLVVSGLGGVLQIASGVLNFFVNNWGAIAPIITGIAGAILIYKGAVMAIQVAQKAWNAVQLICTAAQWAWNVALSANPIGIIIVAIGALIAIGVALWMNWDNVCAWCKQAFQAVGDFFVSVGNSIASFFVGLWTGIKDTAVSVWQGITGFLSGAWNTIASAATSVFTGIGNAVKNVWNGIVNAIKGAINKIISGINSMIRGAVNGINGLINGINKVTGAVGIPAIPTFTAPQIPMLAQGGLIRTAGSVIVGEKGPELLNLPQGAKVTPIDKSSKRTDNHFIINIYADGKSTEDIINDLVPKLKLALTNL
ncbi:hypothetical protein [Ructibacterium gallinarum]|uniref:Uncharacterized protein n=1 Tax=Ructibacterium gallinarum TaxID=2779355 RepID=A0A9D5M5H6_9FIRM|nr:hypothetical protein [Ructibacterium gallinarum]MBE5039812.1 hypothetical protein [Ructibacterium gallinarum]